LAPILASTVQEALTILGSHTISLIFCFDELPGDGPDVLIRRSFSKARARVPVVVVSRIDDWGRYLDFLHYGAFDYVLYPLAHSEVERVVSNIRNLPTLSILQESDCAERRQIFSQLQRN
jgi:response regulator of citrate/malate metabolism